MSEIMRTQEEVEEEKRKDREEQDRIVKKFEYMFELMDAVKTRKERRCRYPISFGFQCDRGWYPLIEKHLQELHDLDSKKECRVFQIKEKFGGLRVYLETKPSDIEDMEALNLSSKIEKESYTICEICGEEGSPCTVGGWCQTLCKKHAEERNGHKIKGVV